MPYTNEHSKHKSISDLINSEKVKSFIHEMKILSRGKSGFEKIDDLIFTKEYDIAKNNLNYVFAFDGSKSQIPIDTGYPGAEIGIIKVSQTFVQLELMKKYEQDAFPHPSDYDEIFINQNFEMTVPGFNVCSEIYEDPKDFFRYTIYNYLENNYNTFLDILNTKSNKNVKPITFLDTYLNLLEKTTEITCIHPCEFCCSNNTGFLSFNDFYEDNLEEDKIEFKKVTKCSCKLNPRDVFITDLLHFHEGFSNSGANEGLYNQIMSFLEKIVFINLIQNINNFFENKEDNRLFKECAFILDGPLAIYNYASWFASSISEELILLNEKNSILVIGVEKTGHFVQHLKNLNSVESKEDMPLENGCLFFLDDNYIKRYVKFSTSPVPYGKNIYFGNKLFYKNLNEQLFVINLGYSSIEDKNDYLNGKNSRSYIAMQKRLIDLIWLLEKFYSLRYENALSFVSMAHENASISNNYFSKRVIDNFVKDNII